MTDVDQKPLVRPTLERWRGPILPASSDRSADTGDLSAPSGRSPWPSWFSASGGASPVGMTRSGLTSSRYFTTVDCHEYRRLTACMFEPTGEGQPR